MSADGRRIGPPGLLAAVVGLGKNRRFFGRVLVQLVGVVGVVEADAEQFPRFSERRPERQLLRRNTPRGRRLGVWKRRRSGVEDVSNRLSTGNSGRKWNVPLVVAEQRVAIGGACEVPHHPASRLGQRPNERPGANTSMSTVRFSPVFSLR